MKSTIVAFALCGAAVASASGLQAASLSAGGASTVGISGRFRSLLEDKADHEAPKPPKDGEHGMHGDHTGKPPVAIPGEKRPMPRKGDKPMDGAMPPVGGDMPEDTPPLPMQGKPGMRPMHTACEKHEDMPDRKPPMERSMHEGAPEKRKGPRMGGDCGEEFEDMPDMYAYDDEVPDMPDMYAYHDDIPGHFDMHVRDMLPPAGMYGGYGMYGEELYGEYGVGMGMGMDPPMHPKHGRKGGMMGRRGGGEEEPEMAGGGGAGKSGGKHGKKGEKKDESDGGMKGRDKKSGKERGMRGEKTPSDGMKGGDGMRPPMKRGEKPKDDKPADAPMPARDGKKKPEGKPPMPAHAEGPMPVHAEGPMPAKHGEHGEHEHSPGEKKPKGEKPKPGDKAGAAAEE